MRMELPRNTFQALDRYITNLRAPISDEQLAEHRQMRLEGGPLPMPDEETLHITIDELQMPTPRGPRDSDSVYSENSRWEQETFHHYMSDIDQDSEEVEQPAFGRLQSTMCIVLGIR